MSRKIVYFIFFPLKMRDDTRCCRRVPSVKFELHVLFERGKRFVKMMNACVYSAVIANPPTTDNSNDESIRILQVTRNFE